MQTKTKTNCLSYKSYVQLCSSIPCWSSISGTNFIDYKWAVNIYKCLTVDLLDLCPLNFSFHMVSCKYIPSYTIFHDCIEQFYNATWVGVNSNWISQLLYEFMNTFQQPWKVSNNFTMVNVYTKPFWLHIYHCLIHIQDYCKWSQDIPSHITLIPFLNQWHSSIFISYISSYNK